MMKELIFKTLVILLFSVFHISFVYSESNDPQQIIAHFENEIRGISSEQTDSIKNSLLSKYIQEYRNNGKEAALDSLQTRVDRLLDVKKENTEKNISLEPLSGRKNTSQNPMQRMISTEIEKTRQDADFLTLQMLETREEAMIVPIYFDSISHSDFLNYIQISKPGYKTAIDTSTSVINFFAKKREVFMFRDKQRRRTVNALAVTNPEFIKYYNLSAYDDKGQYIRSSGEKIVPVDVSEYKTDIVFEKLTNLLRPKKQSNWSSNGKLNVQISQYYVTKNWHKGGEPNATLLGLFEYYNNYNNNDKLIWDNGVDIRIGFFNSGIDTLRAFRVYNDVFKINSRLGYQTFYKKLYYSLYGEFNTSMFTGYAGTNSSEVVTAFLSPTRIFMSLGFDYRHNKKTSVQVAPLAYKLIFLLSDDINPLYVGIKNGKSLNSFGYMTQARTHWQFSNEISVNSNFSLFSTYNFKDIEFNLETVGNFVINRYLSTRLSLNMRFDNTPKRPDKNSKDKGKEQYEKQTLQIQELLSFGFYYKF